MATAILYTTIESIRSCVGLDVADVPDELILGKNLRMQFILDLDTWYPAVYEDDWSDADFDPTDDSDSEIIAISPTERKGYLLSNYSMWFGAYRLIESLLAIPQKISDGKDEIQRFQGINLEKMLERVRQNMATVRTLIEQENTNTTYEILGVSRVESESYDPVTGT